jgi:predicted AlkP superfamily pyrophosphatase or phosphodiesterase
MDPMLPSLDSGAPSLAAVLPSSLASLGLDFPNLLKLSPARSCVVVMVDGLGASNLASAAGHARFLATASSVSSTASSVFPSTTAAALATLTTGRSPGEHGMVGYRVREPETGRLLNQLKELDQLQSPAEWLCAQPLYLRAAELGVRSAVVQHPRFGNTVFTTTVHRGATHVGAASLDERVDAALELARAATPQLVVLYISELDEVAHQRGVGSLPWTTTLEAIDGALQRLARGLPATAGMLVTADHGVIDVPATRHYLFGDDATLLDGVAAIGGEPRGLQLYLVDGRDPAAVADLWREAYRELAWVCTRDEAVDAGLFGPVSDRVRPRVGDVLVIARKTVAFYDSRDARMSGRTMVGQHGALSAEELGIPLIRLGCFAA